jgi:protein involved in polysaccharide export with SLBB domain
VYFVIEDIGAEARQSYGLLVGDEVNVMAFVGQGFSQFRGQYSTASESRITNNPDVHGRRWLDDECTKVVFMQRSNVMVSLGQFL